MREYRFLQPAEATVLSERRELGPWGLHGAQAGAPGRNTLVTADGRETNLGAKAAIAVEPGDTLRIETPGGGGWNQPDG